MKTATGKTLSSLEWIVIGQNDLGGQFQHVPTGLRVIESREDFHADGREWLHVSLSYPNRLPGHEDMKRVKDRFIGETRTALQIFPPKDHYVNDHPYVLHLWCCLDDENIVPDFRRYGPRKGKAPGLTL